MLKKLIDNHMRTIQANNNRDHSKFHPSAIGYCSRKITYSMLGYEEEPVDTITQRIFENGHSMHARYEKWFEDMGIQIAPELVLSENSEDPEIARKARELNIDGRTDSLIEVNGERYIVELKSAGQAMFEYHLNKGPKKHHLQQILMYMYLTGVKKGILLYENKNTQEIREFAIEYDEEIVEDLIKKASVINSYVLEKKLPPKEGTASSWQCKYCNYFNLCMNPGSPASQAKIQDWERQNINIVDAYNSVRTEY